MFFDNIIFQNKYMELETPPFMENSIQGGKEWSGKNDRLTGTRGGRVWIPAKNGDVIYE